MTAKKLKAPAKTPITPRQVDTSETGVRERAWRNAALAAREAIDLDVKLATVSGPMKPLTRRSMEHKWVCAVISLLTALS